MRGGKKDQTKKHFNKRRSVFKNPVSRAKKLISKEKRVPKKLICYQCLEEECVCENE